MFKSCPKVSHNECLQRHGHPEEKSEEFRFEYPFPLYLIFNPYSHDDEVHFPDTEVCWRESVTAAVGSSHVRLKRSRNDIYIFLCAAPTRRAGFPTTLACLKSTLETKTGSSGQAVRTTTKSRNGTMASSRR